MTELDLDLHLDDVVIFELPSAEHAEAFEDRFRTRWGGWSDLDANVWLFSAYLGAHPSEPAELLRGAEELLADLGVSAIRFYLDGRAYVLRAVRRVTDAPAPAPPPVPERPRATSPGL